jgi:DNA polymerase-3 subunit delta
MPFLSKKRLVVLKDADALSGLNAKGILSYLGNPKESSIFIIESNLPAIKGGFILEISRLARLVYFRRLKGPAIDDWLVKKAVSAGKKILPQAVSAIKENLSNDLRAFSFAMDNLIMYIGRRETITKEDVEKVIGISASHTVFDLMDTIKKRNAKKALEVFSSLKKDRKKETELLGLLAWNTRMILRIRELLKIKKRTEICRDLSLNPRSFERISNSASAFKKAQILTLLDEILKADLDIKTGMSSTLVIEKLIVKMCSPLT